MSRGGANFTSKELASVLGYYDLGMLKGTKAVDVGSKAAPKKAIVSARGKFLLKRRSKGKDDIYHVAFAHAIQAHLEKKGFEFRALFRLTSKKIPR